MPSFVVADTNSLYKTNVSYLNTDDNKWETSSFDGFTTLTGPAEYWQEVKYAFFVPTIGGINLHSFLWPNYSP